MGLLLRTECWLLVSSLAAGAPGCGRFAAEKLPEPPPGARSAGTSPAASQTLPADWRPFADDAIWNVPIAADARPHRDSDAIIANAAARAPHPRFARQYAIPVWVVDSERVPRRRLRSDRIFDTWDLDRDGWTDAGAPLPPGLWAEPTPDGHLCIVDPERRLSWEMSRYAERPDGTPTCTTYNLWDLAGPGVGNSDEGERWEARGGRGSGFPLIAGLLRPEEFGAGAIRHALVFTFGCNRRAEDGSRLFIEPPACRSDGECVGKQYPIEGMRFQLDPAAGEADFDAWGLTSEARMVARALQTYGMFLGDNGGDMALQVQLLDRSPEKHRRAWEARWPGLYAAIERLPTNRFRVLDTGEATRKP